MAVKLPCTLTSCKFGMKRVMFCIRDPEMKNGSCDLIAATW